MIDLGIAIKWLTRLRGLPGASPCSPTPSSPGGFWAPILQLCKRFPSSQRPKERQLGSRHRVKMGSGCPQPPLMRRETGAFHTSGEARQQEEGNRERRCRRQGWPGRVWRGGACCWGSPPSPARCRKKASFPSQISCLGFQRPEQGAEGAQEQERGGCQAGLASDEWWPGTGTMVGKGHCSHAAREAGFPGKLEVRGRAESAPAD